jgi:hypothetical protein
MNLLLAQLLRQVSKQVLMQTQQKDSLGYTSAAAGAVYSSSLGFARNIVVSPRTMDKHYGLQRQWRAAI